VPAVEAYNLDTRRGRVFSFAPHNRSGRFWGRRNLLPLPRFKPRTVYTVASRNTSDCPGFPVSEYCTECRRKWSWSTLDIPLHGGLDKNAGQICSGLLMFGPRLELSISGIKFCSLIACTKPHGEWRHVVWYMNTRVL
jgi:hypothetical protein